MIKLSERQSATAAAALTVLATAVILCALAVVFWLVAYFLRAFSNVLMPLAVAAVVALVLGPYYDWWVRRLGAGWLERWRLRRVLAIGLVFLSLVLPLAGVGTYFGVQLPGQIAELTETVTNWWTSVEEKVETHWPQIKEYWEAHRAQIQEAFAGKEESVLQGLRFLGKGVISAGADLFSFIGSLLNWTLVPIYVAFFLLIDFKKNKETWSDTALPFLKTGTREDIAYLLTQFLAIIVAFFRGQLVIALLQGILFAVGFGIVGLKAWLILGLMLGFLNIIPYLGSIVGLLVVVPLSYFQEGGGLWTTVSVLVVFTVVQMIEGYLLTPKIMGEQTGLHPMAIMVAIFFWSTALDGILGMLLAIPLTAFFVVFWRLVRDKYIRELV